LWLGVHEHLSREQVTAAKFIDGLSALTNLEVLELAECVNLAPIGDWLMIESLPKLARLRVPAACLPAELRGVSQGTELAHRVRQYLAPLQRAHGPGVADNTRTAAIDRDASVALVAIYRNESTQDFSNRLRKTPELCVWRQPDDNGNTLLHEAAHAGREGIVVALLEANPSVINVTNKQGRTALHEAAHGRLGIVSLLVQRGADVGVKSNFNLTAHDEAAQAGCSEVSVLSCVACAETAKHTHTDRHLLRIAERDEGGQRPSRDANARAHRALRRRRRCRTSRQA
jgi:hypothetical protein